MTRTRVRDSAGKTGGDGVESPEWWTPVWSAGSEQDPDTGWSPDRTVGPEAGEEDPASDGPWHHTAETGNLDDAAILVPMEAQFGQVRSRARVRDLAEVFTHQREVDAMLDLIPDAFAALDVKFLEPSAGSGNFLTEILRRKLRLVTKAGCVSQEQYEHRLLRAAASIYGVDISQENVTEARARMVHVVLEHYHCDANTVEPTTGVLSAAALILGSNIVVGDTLRSPDAIEMCDWRPRSAGRFQRVWSYALVPPAERSLFWAERVQDAEPVHYSELAPACVQAVTATHSKAEVDR